MLFEQTYSVLMKRPQLTSTFVLRFIAVSVISISTSMLSETQCQGGKTTVYRDYLDSDGSDCVASAKNTKSYKHVKLSVSS
jgi:hypothetical protein